MADSSDQLVTIIGSSYFQPITNLIEILIRHPKPEPNEVQAGYYENGYCASIVLLLVTMFESYVMRVRYLNRETIPIKRISVTKYLDELYPDYDKSNELTEVFVVRDVIAHNHLWEIDFSWSDDPVMTLNKADKEPTAGDVKYRTVVDRNKMKTPILGMNVIPTKVGRIDAMKVFDMVWDAMLFLEGKNRNQCYVSHLHVKFKGKTRLFGDLRSELRNGL